MLCVAATIVSRRAALRNRPPAARANFSPRNSNYNKDKATVAFADDGELGGPFTATRCARPPPRLLDRSAAGITSQRRVATSRSILGTCADQRFLYNRVLFFSANKLTATGPGSGGETRCGQDADNGHMITSRSINQEGGPVERL